MSIFRTAYDTRVGRPLIIKKIQEALQDLQVQHNSFKRVLPAWGQARSGSDEKSVWHDAPLFIAGKEASQLAAVPPFNHPVPVTIPSLGAAPEQHWLIADVRSFTKPDPSTTEGSRVVNSMEFEFSRARTQLTTLWNNGGVATLRFISPIAQSVFASWLAENISRRFALDIGDQMRLQVLAAFYYHCLFSNQEEMREEEMVKIAPIVARAAKAPANVALEIIARANVITDIEDFIEKARTCLDSPRLETLSIGVLATIISGTWFGTDGKASACAAMEHPPTFLAMLYISFAERGFRNTAFSRISERYKGAKGEADYIRAVAKLLDKQ